jgi:hypothetical protein
MRLFRKLKWLFGTCLILPLLPHDSDLELMLKVYAKSAQFDEESFVRLGLGFNQKNKDRKTRKRKIKQALGLW